MSSLGKTINLYLMDGSASGRWQATLSNWNGTAYKIPHGDLKDCTDLPELNKPGVYFLFGKDDESGRQFIYVGEADDVQKRLLQHHTFEKDDSYWTEAVIFVTADETLNKGHVKYLENRFYSIACESKRYIVKNGNTPKQSPMSKQTRDMLEEFIINAKLVMPALGYTVFEPSPSSNKAEKGCDEDLLYFSRNKGKGGSATGRIASDGFWVLKGSYIYPKVADYISAGIKKLRAEHATLIDRNGILQEDICFGSPSYASTFVCGKNSNGLLEWKNKYDVSLKNIDAGVNAPSAKNKSVKDTSVHKRSANPDSKAGILHLAGKKVAATGQFSGDEFVVLKGSGFSVDETKSCSDCIKTKRAELLAEGKVKNGVFTEDVRFKSPSAAAACVIGGTANGNVMWLYFDGKTIKEKMKEE